MKTLITLFICAIAFSPTASHAVAGIVFATDGPRILILKTGGTLYNGNEIRAKYYALTNYPGTNATMGKFLSVSARRIGVYDWGDAPIEFYDCTPANVITGAAAYAASKTNSANGKVYIANAQKVLAQLEANKSEIDSKISALQSSGAATNAAGSSAVAQLQAQQVDAVLKIESQKSNLQRLTNYYHLTVE